MKSLKNSYILLHKEKVLFDLSYMGTMARSSSGISVIQENHLLTVGDVIYYDVAGRKFSKAVAHNTIESEACGIVSSVEGQDTFTFISDGFINTDRYAYATGMPLYLSETIPGKLMANEPLSVYKPIAIQGPEGITVNIQRGFKLENNDVIDTFEAYTKDELDNIIGKAWS